MPTVEENRRRVTEGRAATNTWYPNSIVRTEVEAVLNSLLGSSVRLFGGGVAFLTALSGGTASAVAASPAQSVAAPASQAVPGLLRQALHRYGAVSLLRTEPGPHGLTAALVSAGGQKAIVWILGGGRAVAVGDVWDAEGHNLTRDMAIRMGLLPRPLAPAAVAAAVAQHKTLLLGTKGPEVTLFLDPSCIFCHQLYEEAVPLIDQGRLQLRVVMVGFLKPTSFARAAAILMAADPAHALASDEQGFNVTAEEGGVAPAEHIPTAVREAVAANTKLLAASGAEATPTLLFRDRAGAWQLMHHVPPEGIAAWLAHREG